MKPIVIWLTGLSGAGKTSIGKALYDKLKNDYKIGFLDGEEVRKSLEEKKERIYGFSLKERSQFINNVVYMARNMIEFQETKIIIVALISPLEEMRKNARDLLKKYSNAIFIEVHVDTPIEICEQRDTKGLYKKAKAGEIKDFTGIDSPYERTPFPEVRINYETTLYGKMTIERSVDLIFNRIVTHLG